MTATPARATPAWRWGYPLAAGTRDLRIDFLRGLAILFVVVDHINIPSLYHLLSHERIAAVSGAELFVVFSGVVLGMVYRRRLVEEGWPAVARKIWSRAVLLYLTSLAVAVTIYALNFVPFLDASAVTTWTDEVTGTAYSMYPTTPLLLEYPVPPRAVLDLVLLNVGPFQFNVIGLYVVLLALAPFAFRVLLAGRWWLLLGASWVLYLMNGQFHLRLFSSQFENVFPLLSWQLLFVHGLVFGFHWKAVVAWFDSPLGRVTILTSILLSLVFLFFTWNNPWPGIPFDIRLRWIPQDLFVQMYESYFRRDFLGILRITNVAALIVTAYAVLTKFWVPINRAFGWFFVPLGGATLYVFILHVYFAFVVANIPALDEGNLWSNTLAHTVILMLLWLMVKRGVLFRWIAR